MSDITTKLVSDLTVYTGDLENDHVIMLHNNTDTVKVPFSIFNAESNIPSVPSSPTDDGSLGDVVADDTAVYTYANGQWGKTPRNLDWGAEYLRTDPNSPALTATQTETLQRILPKASDTPGIIRLAEDPTEIYVDDQSYATTPAYVRGYVAVAINDASGSDITSNYLPNDTVYAITGKGVSEALTTIDIPEVVSTYSPDDDEAAISGKGVSNALSEFKQANITSTYNSTGTQAITGTGVAVAIEAASQDIIAQVNADIADSYDPNSDKAISGKGVSLAISGVVMPNISDEYDPNNHTSGVTGHAVSDALNTLDIPEITSTYNASDTTMGTSGAAVAQAVAAIPNATATARGMVKLGVSSTLSGDTVKGIGVNADGALAVDTYGLSAYEIAVKDGFEGTEEEWLASLDGKSAYELAVENGFEGTEEEWLESLSDPVVARVQDELIDALQVEYTTKAPTDGFEVLTQTNKAVRYIMISKDSIEPGVTTKIRIPFATAPGTYAASPTVAPIWLGVWSGSINTSYSAPWDVSVDDTYGAAWTRMARSKNSVNPPDGTADNPYGAVGEWEFDNLVIPDATDIILGFLTEDLLDYRVISTTGPIVEINTYVSPVVDGAAVYPSNSWVNESTAESAEVGSKVWSFATFNYFEFAPRLHVSNATKHLTAKEHQAVTDLLYHPEDSVEQLLTTEPTHSWNISYAVVDGTLITKRRAIKSVSINFRNGSQVNTNRAMRLLMRRIKLDAATNTFIDDTDWPVAVSTNTVYPTDGGTGEWFFESTTWNPPTDTAYMLKIGWMTNEDYEAETEWNDSYILAMGVTSGTNNSASYIRTMQHGAQYQCISASITFEPPYVPNNQTAKAIISNADAILSLAERASDILALLS